MKIFASEGFGAKVLGVLPGRFALMILSLLTHAAGSPNARAWEQPAEVKPADLIGKAVVQKFRSLSLRDDIRPASRKGLVQPYVVEKANQDELWLKGVLDDARGRVKLAEVIPVDDALGFFDGQIRSNPNDGFSYLMRAIIRSASMKTYDRQVLSDLDKAIGLSPSAQAFGTRGSLRMMERDYDKAIADLTEAARLAPDIPDSYIDRASAWYQKQNYEKAIADYTQAIRLAPNRHELHLFRGLAWRHKKEYDKAIADFDEVIRLEPNEPRAYSARGTAFKFKREYPRAIADFDQAIRLDPSVASNHFTRAWCGFVLGRNADAFAGMKESIDREGWGDEQSAYATIIGALAARRAGKLRDARALLDEFKAKGNKAAWPYPVIRFLRGEIDAKALMTASTDNDRRCESHCYVGLDLLIKKKSAAAKDHLLWIKEHGNQEFVEYAIALAELDRMDSPKPAANRR